MVGAGESHYLLVCIFFISFDCFWVLYFLGRLLAIEGNESLLAEVCGVGVGQDWGGKCWLRKFVRQPPKSDI
jgi:hypothetical protein